ncbi:unnamed protein product, partial [Oppiella nova]
MFKILIITLSVAIVAYGDQYVDTINIMGQYVSCLDKIPSDVGDKCLTDKLGPSKSGDEDRHRICCSIWALIDCARLYEKDHSGVVVKALGYSVVVCEFEPRYGKDFVTANLSSMGKAGRKVRTSFCPNPGTGTSVSVPTRGCPQGCSHPGGACK